MSNKLLRNALNALFGSVSTAVINFITIPLLLKGLGINSYGELSIILTSFLVIQVLTSLQPWQAFIKFWYEPNVDRNKILSFSLLTDCVSCLIGSLVLFFTLRSERFEEFFFYVDNVTALAVSFGLLFNQFSFFVGVCRIRDNFSYISFCEFLRAFIRLIGALII
ncbi:TPA: lipopolysaccharide biosynthesis protein, partial [Vibrio diabolicus]